MSKKKSVYSEKWYKQSCALGCLICHGYAVWEGNIDKEAKMQLGGSQDQKLSVVEIERKNGSDTGSQC